MLELASSKRMLQADSCVGTRIEKDADGRLESNLRIDQASSHSTCHCRVTIGSAIASPKRFEPTLLRARELQ